MTGAGYRIKDTSSAAVTLTIFQRHQLHSYSPCTPIKVYYLFNTRVEKNMSQDNFLESAEENTIQFSVQFQPRENFHCTILAVKEEKDL